MKKDKINFPVDLKAHFILIKDVPGFVCKEFGDFIIDDKLHMELESIMEKTKASIVKLEIVKFAD